MKASWRTYNWLIRSMGALVLAVCLSGCQTTPKVDWTGRIGAYTFDQAVIDFGPPDKLAILTDGTKVAEWLTSRGYSHGYVTTLGAPYPYHHGFYGPPSVYYSEPASPDRFLRLTFLPDGKLSAWRKVYK